MAHLLGDIQRILELVSAIRAPKSSAILLAGFPCSLTGFLGTQFTIIHMLSDLCLRLLLEHSTQDQFMEGMR